MKCIKFAGNVFCILNKIVSVSLSLWSSAAFTFPLHFNIQRPSADTLPA